MNIYVNVDLHQLIQSPGARSAASPWEIKSQDTLATNLFFCSSGVVLDLGESPALSFGLVAKSNVTTLLVFENVFVRLVDPANGVYYQAFCEFNTIQMVAALATLSPLPCILEIRFELADGEIVHTLDQVVTVDRTILVEGAAPAATVIAVYPDPSVLEIKSHKDQPSGYAALDSGGHLTPSVIPSTVELIASRDVASGHAGLDSGALLLAAEIPVDGVTTMVVAGKIVAVGPSQGVLAATTEAFTVPAVSADVTLSTPTSSLTAGNFYTISGAGSYQLVSITDDTHGVFLNLGGPLNAVPTTVIALGATISWSGPPGIQGLTGAASTTPGPAGQGLTWRGAWVVGTAYAPYDMVSRSGSAYLNIIANTGSDPATDGGVNWALVAAGGTNGTNGTNGVSFLWRGAWAIGTAYVLNNVVSRSGSAYINILANTGSDPNTDAGVHWAPFALGGTSFVWMGAWAIGTAYIPNNVVSRSGSTYINILANTGSDPNTDGGVHWVLFTAAGINGTGTGDMVKSIYDTVNRGYVDRAVLSDRTSSVTSANVSGLATSLAGKAALVHTHVKADVTDLGVIGTAAALDVATSGDAGPTQVVTGNDSRLEGAAAILLPTIYIPTPTVKIYPVLFSCPTTYTGINFTTRMKSGSCSFTVNRNGTAMTGSTAAGTTVSANTIGTTLNPADLIELNITVVSSPVDLVFQMTLTP